MKPKLVRIYTENNDFQHLELSAEAEPNGIGPESFVEGVRAINQAMENNWQFQSFVFSGDKRLSDWASAILKKSTAAFHYEMPQALLEKLSQKESPSELIAVITIPEDELLRIPALDVPLIVVLDRIMSPGNLGTIIRSCDALGVDGIIVTGHAADVYAPETIRATTGSFFSIPIIRLGSPKELNPWLDHLKQKYPGLKIVGTSASSDISIQKSDFSSPTVLLIGNENHGLSQYYRTLADEMLTIPMRGSATSMNVACATSIILYEITQQRS